MTPKQQQAPDVITVGPSRGRASAKELAVKQARGARGRHTHRTRVDWNARKPPRMPVNAASPMLPSKADRPEMAPRAIGRLRDGWGMTVGRTTRGGGAASFLANSAPRLKLLNSCEGKRAAGAWHCCSFGVVSFACRGGRSSAVPQIAANWVLFH